MDKSYFTELKNGVRLKPKSLEKENKQLYNKIIKYSIDNNFTELPFKEKVWLFVEGKNEIPKCLECGTPTNFERFNSGYRTFCSKSCKSKNKIVKEKIKNTFIEKYGGHPMKSDVIKKKIEDSNLKKYGHKSHLSSNEIKNKIEKTNLEKYGVKRPLQSVEILNKTQKTLLEKYGVNHGLQSKEIRDKTHISFVENNDISALQEKIGLTKLERYGDVNYNNTEKYKETCKTKYGVSNILNANSPFRKLISDSKLKNSLQRYKHSDKVELITVGDECLLYCSECDNNFTIPRHFLVMRGNGGHIMCLHCNPYGNMYINSEIEIESFLDVEFIKRDREILEGKEIDILIPSHKIGIEYNGLYWHSDVYKDNNYHLDKTKLANSKGYQLIHIFEDEWFYKEDIVKSIINNKLNIIDKKIYARNCEIREVTSKESSKFLKENHIQGKINSFIKLGLYYDNELVSLMTFGKLRKSLGSDSKDCDFEMYRFCNKLNYSVVGGASKLFKYFIKNFNVNKIVSYSDNRYFDGSLYEKLGFIYNGETKPSYWYTKNINRYHRFKFRKDVLVKDGYNPNKTEKEIMKERGYNRIYDCGNKKWVFINK
jgi:hypothetical protein